MPAKPQHSRRRLLKALAGAGGVYAAGKVLPEQWTKPVVDAVSLPAHAQTSAPFFDVIELSETVGTRVPSGGFLDLIIPKARAQERTGEAHICVTPAGDEVLVDVVVLNFFALPGIRFDGSVAVGGETSLDIVDFSEGCGTEPKKIDISFRLDSLATGALIIDSIPYGFELPQAPCELPDLPPCVGP